MLYIFELNVMKICKSLRLGTSNALRHNNCMQDILKYPLDFLFFFFCIILKLLSCRAKHSSPVVYRDEKDTIVDGVK